MTISTALKELGDLSRLSTRALERLKDWFEVEHAKCHDAAYEQAVRDIDAVLLSKNREPAKVK